MPLLLAGSPLSTTYSPDNGCSLLRGEPMPWRSGCAAARPSASSGNARWVARASDPSFAVTAGHRACVVLASRSSSIARSLRVTCRLPAPYSRISSIARARDGPTRTSR
jgi:hypothetical protein